MVNNKRQCKRKKTLVFALGFGCFLCIACTQPSPLYGTWADNRANTLSFYDDDTFNAKIVSSADSSSLNYSGNYSVLLNVLTLDCTEADTKVVTEWDIRGNILYLDWVTPDRNTLALTLFKVSN